MRSHLHQNSLCRYNYKTVSLSVTSKTVKEESFWPVRILLSENSILLTQMDVSNIKTSTTSIPPAYEKAEGYEFVLSAAKTGDMI